MSANTPTTPYAIGFRARADRQKRTAFRMLGPIFETRFSKLLNKIALDVAEEIDFRSLDLEQTVRKLLPTMIAKGNSNAMLLALLTKERCWQTNHQEIRLKPSWIRGIEGLGTIEVLIAYEVYHDKRQVVFNNFLGLSDQ